MQNRRIFPLARFAEPALAFFSRRPFGALARRIYAAFLISAAVPTAIAGAIGIYLSLQTLRQETLRNLNQEVQIRSQGIAHFLGQLSSELLYLANTREVADLARALAAKDAGRIAASTRLLERDYSALAALYPHIYQIRFLDPAGNELVRIDRRGEQVFIVPKAQLQSKADRYYFREAMKIQPGQIYVSPLDLNIEFGVVEKPERPVIRLASPVPGSPRGGSPNGGMVIVNLHADILIEHIQQMADARRGTAYLLDRAGHYLARSAGDSGSAFSMEPVATLQAKLPAPLAEAMLESGTPLQKQGWIIARASIDLAPKAQGGSARSQWAIALAFPERALFYAVFNLYMLYGVLFAALLVTAAGGYLLSRRLLGPLEDLAAESDAIAGGDFKRRVRIVGDDEIAALGDRFNRMAERLDASYRTLNAHRDRLEDEVRARTNDLEHERRSLEAIIGNTADGILAVDRAGAVQLANPAAHALLNPPGALIGEALATFWPQWPEIAADAAAGVLRCDVELPTRVLALTVTPTTAGYIVVARDVSRERAIQDERRELDRQMFQMEKLTTLGELAMGLAHEIGNPLAGMKTVAQAMQYEEDIPPGLLEALKRLEAEIDRLSGFLRTFHGFAAPQAIIATPCWLANSLDEVLFWTRKDARSLGIDFELQGIPELPALWADPAQLKQVLLNLLMNAVHAMPAGGHLVVRAARDGERARIDIVDSGCGIAPEILGRIFEPFFTTRREGSGLGLSIVRKIVEQHGGNITVASEPGHGTCVSILWPFAENRNDAQHA